MNILETRRGDVNCTSALGELIEYSSRLKKRGFTEFLSDCQVVVNYYSLYSYLRGSTVDCQGCPVCWTVYWPVVICAQGPRNSAFRSDTNRIHCY